MQSVLVMIKKLLSEVKTLISEIIQVWYNCSTINVSFNKLNP